MTTRRDAIRQLAGMLVAGRGMLGCSARGSASHPLPPIGLQLYTLRTLLEKDTEATLAAIAEIGFREVELAGTYGHSPKAFRAMLDRVGLRAVASHESIERIRTERDRMIDDALTLGQRWIVCPWINEGDRTVAGVRRVMQDFAGAASAARTHGMRFAYHNHDYAFRPFSDGTRMYDLMLNDPAGRDVAMELDVYWIVAGGADPLTYFAKYPGRFPLLHLKDRTSDGKMANVGEGAIDWKTILSHRAEAGVEHMFVEHDDPPRGLPDAATSLAYLRRMA